MIRRWSFFLSLALAVSAFSIQWCSIDEYLHARRQQTQDFLNKVAASSVSSDALLHQSRILSYIAMPIATFSAFCLFLSHRRKKPIALVWRCGVALLLSCYIYGVVGPL